MNRYFLSLVFSFFAITLFAQEQIQFRDGTVKNVQIIRINQGIFYIDKADSSKHFAESSDIDSVYAAEGKNLRTLSDKRASVFITDIHRAKNSLTRVSFGKDSISTKSPIVVNQDFNDADSYINRAKHRYLKGLFLEATGVSLLLYGAILNSQGQSLIYTFPMESLVVFAGSVMTVSGIMTHIGANSDMNHARSIRQGLSLGLQQNGVGLSYRF